jgi:ankyrin repeat protein
LVENGNKALHVCAEYGRVEIFEWFVERYSANTMMTNYHGETPFHIAAKEHKPAIIKMYHEKYT